MSLDTAQAYKLRESLHLKSDGKGLLVLDTRTYSVHELNETAALVARMCDGATSCEQMVVTLACDHETDPRHAAEVVYKGLQLLREQGLVEPT